MERAQLLEVVERQIKGLADEFDPEDFNDAIDAAERDTGWDAPYATEFKEKWMIQRTKRHLYSALMSDTAGDFKYKQINLQQAFEHYYKLVQTLDKEFLDVLDREPHEFAGASVYDMFGHKIDAGFASEAQTGRDLTYDKDRLVIITPNENS